MPFAGQTIRAADFDGYASTLDTTDETGFNSTAYTLGGTTVGVAFRAPTSGSVLLMWTARGRLNATAGERVLVSAEVRTGSTVGSGTVIDAAVDDSSVEWGQATNDRLSAGHQRVVTGLTAGTTYNVSLWHRNAISTASAGSLFYRSVQVTPWID